MASRKTSTEVSLRTPKNGQLQGNTPHNTPDMDPGRASLALRTPEKLVEAHEPKLENETMERDLAQETGGAERSATSSHAMGHSDAH